MNLIIFIAILFTSAYCDHIKQPSELNYVIAKPDTILPTPSPILHHSSLNPVNLVKYGKLAGYPIQTLSYGQNLAYIKPILNYDHHK